MTSDEFKRTCAKVIIGWWGEDRSRMGADVQRMYRRITRRRMRRALARDIREQCG